MANMKQVSPSVFVADQPVSEIGLREIEIIKQVALTNGQGQARICAHENADDNVHEMLIALTGKPYVRAHRHPGKTESFHMIEGRLTVVLFDYDGLVDRRVALGALGTDRSVYYRLSRAQFHTVLAEDDMVVFHEVTNGPFLGSAEMAPWAPDQNDELGQKAFLSKLKS